ncbi:hypothetical protein COCON_G00200240 [Conger conger]|uniref:C2H2-type domain-containing protein n=1 Tax=Conger conger TaxID=82655 RepID=A0A9Q1HRD4_CONCO|nr:hypothetical protein COCON_G00200240 [Conger conger]
MSMIKHALASHPGDIKVQEFAFNWRKGKCEFCQRIFWSFLHYQDHRKRHDHPLRYSCLHVDCDDRFKTKSELRAHLKSHRPLKARCSFAGCSQTFCRLSQLQDHEWRHYPAPDAEDDSLRAMQMRRKVGRAAGGKRTAGGKRKAAPDDSVKVQDTSAKPQAAVVLSSGSGGGKAVTDAVEVEAGDEVACETGAVDRPVGPEGGRRPRARESDKEAAAAEIDNVDGKAEESAASPSQKGVKRAEVESSGYGATSGRPFVRPPPSAYLDECYISMPKRRKSSPDDPRSSKEPSCSSVEAPRRRCSKCFSSFRCEEALQSHLSLNKCTSLFGFDSDEESAW